MLLFTFLTHSSSADKFQAVTVISDYYCLIHRAAVVIVVVLILFQMFDIVLKIVFNTPETKPPISTVMHLILFVTSMRT